MPEQHQLATVKTTAKRSSWMWCARVYVRMCVFVYVCVSTLERCQSLHSLMSRLCSILRTPHLCVYVYVCVIDYSSITWQYRNLPNKAAAEM